MTIIRFLKPQRLGDADKEMNQLDNPVVQQETKLISKLNQPFSNPEPSFQNQTTTSVRTKLTDNTEYLLDLLFSLDGVTQSPKYHPESDALFHSMQVFEHAYQESNDPLLWLAALFHDVGKSVDSSTHDVIGAEMVKDIFPERVVFIIRHHLDLLKSTRSTKRKYANTSLLSDLTKLRRWDLAGREQDAKVRDVKDAFSLILRATE